MKELCTFVYTELPAKSCLSKKFVAYAAYAEVPKRIRNNAALGRVTAVRISPARRASSNSF